MTRSGSPWAAPAGALVAWALVGCVNLTPPWQQAAVGAGGSGGGTGVAALDTAAGAGAVDLGNPVVVDLGSGAMGGATTVPAGGLDGPASGPGGGLDAPPAGVGGTSGGGIALDGPSTGSGGAALDGATAVDAPLPGSDSGNGGATSAGGTRATGGTRGSGGVRGSGGAAGTGGVRSAGGTTGTGGAGTPDAPPDTPHDLASGVEAGALLSGLIAHYPCESANADGVTLPDLSGNGNDATLGVALPPDGGAPGTGTGFSFVAGQVGNALLLTATGRGYVSLPTRVFAGATDLTVSLWIKVTTTVDWQKVLDVGVNANLYNPTTTGMVYMYLSPKIAGNSNAYFGIANNGTTAEQRLASASAIGPSNGWTHVAVVLASGSATMFVNGVAGTPSTTVTLRPKDLGTIDYAWIGRSQFTSNATFDGAVDEVRVYNRALAAEEVQAVYGLR